MGVLGITKTYAALDALMESDIDNFRTGLLTLFNTDGFAAANFSAALTFTSDKFSSTELTTTDGTYLTFGTDSDGLLGVAATKDLIFNTVTASIILKCGSDNKTVEMKSTQFDSGDIIPGAGGAGYGILYLLGRYRKPVLEYHGATTVRLERNTEPTDATLIVFPDWVIQVTEDLGTTQKYRHADISVTANGYAVSHTGAARGGIRDGLSLTTNSWYAVYAARVRYGTNAGNNFIMVFDSILPTQANEATLDGRYGEGQWVYLGMVRYGFGADGTSSNLIGFKYSNKGWCYFNTNDGGATLGGLTLAQSTLDANDAPLYNIADGMAGNVIPVDAVSMGQFNVSRARVSNWYIRDTADSTIWRGGWQEEESAVPHGHQVEIPVQAGIDFCQTRISTGAVDKRVVLTGFCDRFVGVRRHGKGI